MYQLTTICHKPPSSRPDKYLADSGCKVSRIELKSIHRSTNMKYILNLYSALFAKLKLHVVTATFGAK